MLKTKLAIIADDFTGANDTGMQFSKEGAKTAVFLDLWGIDKVLGQIDVVVVDTESRSDTKETAFEKVRQISQTLTENGVTFIYKKLDSTMRGNIGAEIEAALEGSAAKAAIVVPAMPTLGRTTENAICYLYGTPIAETEIAKDPKTPITSSHIPTIINRQSKKEVACIGLEIVRCGSDRICTEIKNLMEKGIEIIVIDAGINDDLSNIGLAVAKLDEKVILAGSTGFAEYIGRPLGIIDSAKQPKPQTSTKAISKEQQFKPVVIIAGSVSEITRSQISYAIEKGLIQAVNLDLEALFNRAEEEKKRIIAEIGTLTAQKTDLVIRSAATRQDVQKAQKLAAEKGFDTFACSEYISRFLGDLTRDICTSFELKGLVLTGGDIAINVGKAMNISGSIIKDEVLPGIPNCNFISDRFGNINVVTKAGAFGNEDALVKIIEFLRR